MKSLVEENPVPLKTLFLAACFKSHRHSYKSQTDSKFSFQNGKTPLAFAAKNHHLAVMKYLVMRDFNVENMLTDRKVCETTGVLFLLLHPFHLLTSIHSLLSRGVLRTLFCWQP